MTSPWQIVGAPSAVWQVENIPQPPVLLAPTDGATDQANALMFRWNASLRFPFCNAWHLQISDNVDFSGTLIVDDDTLTTTSRLISGLPAGTTCYWRVREGDDCWSKNNVLLDNKESGFSSVFSFTVSTYIEHIVDSYSELHGTQIIEWDSGSPPLDGVSQSFTGDGSMLTSCVFSIYQLESFLHATKGSFYATLHEHAGVFGSSSVPGAQLAISAMLDVRANVPDDTTVQVSFPFITPYQSVNGTKYVIVFNYSFPIPDGQGHLGVWYDPSSLATFPGNMAKDIRTWIPNSDADLCFYVNGMWLNQE